MIDTMLVNEQWNTGDGITRFCKDKVYDHVKKLKHAHVFIWYTVVQYLTKNSVKTCITDFDHTLKRYIYCIFANQLYLWHSKCDAIVVECLPPYICTVIGQPNLIFTGMHLCKISRDVLSMDEELHIISFILIVHIYPCMFQMRPSIKGLDESSYPFMNLKIAVL